MEDELSFESLKLLPGTRLDIKSEKYTYLKGVSEFIGYNNQQSIIISTPIVDGVPAACKVGSDIIVRFFVNHLNCVCAFRSEILHVAAIPFAHIYVSVPEAMEVGEVRKSVRANVELDCKVVNLVSKKEPFQCTIKNLSVDGAKMESQFMIAQEGDKIALQTTINVLDVDNVVKIKAKVRSIKLERGHSYSYGLQFLEDNYGKKLLIYSYVLSFLKT